MENKAEEIRIYMACLASYNNGILHGRWIDALSGVDEINAQIRSMLAASSVPGAEEYALHDYEGFEGIRLSEYQGIESIVEIAEFIRDNAQLGAQLITHFGNIDDARRAVEECYAGAYQSVAEFAEDVTEQTGAEIPDNLRCYIDYDAIARDMLINDVFAIEISHDEVHIFWKH